MLYSKLSQIQTDLESGMVSVPQLVAHYLTNINNTSHLNAFLSVYGEEAEKRALEIQSRIDSGNAGKLAGMVIAIKDVLCYQDHPLQCGSKILDGFESQYTATAVQRLLDEDAIIIGRLNCDEFAMGSSNENSAFGPCLNPVDEQRVPGGSSGGSAAAVAADLCLAALGTDTGGSVRQPASFCGTVGLKPTYSRISRYGLAAYASSFDVIGVLSKSVEDAGLLLQVMAGLDEMDSTSSREPVASYVPGTIEPASLKIGVVNELLDGLDPEVRSVVTAQKEFLLEQGHQVEEIEFKGFEYALPTYYILTTAEASTNLSRYDGVRYGHRAMGQEDLTDMYKKSRSEGFGEEVQRRILLGTFVLSSSYYDAYYSKAQKVRRLLRDRTRALFDDYDFILMPTAPTPAFSLGACSSSLEMYLADLFTVQASVAGIPAISLPVGQSATGLPIGVQVMANFFEEDKLISFSNYLMNDTIITAGNGH